LLGCKTFVRISPFILDILDILLILSSFDIHRPLDRKMHGQGPNAYKKPHSVTFSFHQKRFDKGGEIVDDRGQTVYKLRDTGEGHTFGFAKSYVRMLSSVNSLITEKLSSL
jgi:hypothetical protein